MGQYYIPVIRRKDTLEKAYSRDFRNGLKLTEHSYIGNNFVNVIANEIVEKPANIYWVGDYSAPSDFKSEEEFNLVYKYAERNDKTTIITPNEEFTWSEDWYFINNTKREYLLMPKPGNFVFSPIPLLTAIGNGRGGGDYFRADMQGLIGYWAGDEVLLSKRAPEKFSDITQDADFGSETIF